MRKLLTLLVISLLIPTIIIGVPMLFNKEKSYNLDSSIEVRVKRVNLDRIDKVPLEEYIVGVVASEMPPSFAYEALKAQAVAARTYVLKRIDKKADYDVTDTTLHQAYKDLDQLKDKFGILYNSKINKVRSAVYETKGEYLTFEGKIIEAPYFSTSNGYTENSEDYWNFYTPYLRTVTSTWDTQISPYNNVVVSYSTTDFLSNLKLKKAPIKIGKVEKSSGNRVLTIVINGKTFTGKEIRDIFNLNSTDFTISVKNTLVNFTTRGFGHGVGMSQYGAHGMALDGETYDEILKYYYQGVEIKRLN